MSEFVFKKNLEKVTEEQEEKLKLLDSKSLSNKDIILKSIKISLKNWKIQVFIQITQIIMHIFSLYLPRENANLINAVISSGNFKSNIYCF